MGEDKKNLERREMDQSERGGGKRPNSEDQQPELKGGGALHKKKQKSRVVKESHGKNAPLFWVK